MYECAIRYSTGRSFFAGAMVIAIALIECAIVEPASAQTLGRPNVIVDETVLDQLGPPPQTLPDVLLQQQPQAYKPAQRSTSRSAPTGDVEQTGRLLPPPSVMPRSRAMLPGTLKPTETRPSPRSRPQTARVPQKAPQPKPSQPESLPAVATPPVTRALPAPEKAETPETSVVPSEITQPPVSIPPAPTITPPTVAPSSELKTPEKPDVSPTATAPMPSEPPVAEVEMPKAPPAPVEPPVEAKVATPAAPAAEMQKPEEPKVAMPEIPAASETAAVPPPPSIIPPAPQATPQAATPSPADKPQLAEKSTSPRLVRPAPPAPPAATSSAKENEDKASSSDENKGVAQLGTQVAALPEPAPAEILDGGQLYRIPFGTASSEISDDGKKYLDELAQRLKDESALRLQLLGYAGSTQDSASKARRTSLFRALSVRTYLMKQGVRSTRMDVRALGNLVEDGAPDRVDAVVRK